MSEIASGFMYSIILIIIILLILGLIFWVYMIIDCAKRKFKNNSYKIIWILILIFLGIFGGIIYYFVMNNIKIGLNFIIKNPKLLLPDIILLISVIILSILFVFISGVYTIIYSQNFEESLRQLITSPSFFIKILIPLVIAALLSFIIGISMQAAKYELIKNIISNKKITFLKAFSNSKSYFLPILYLKITTFIIYTIPLLILILLMALFKNIIFATILISLLILIWIILITLVLLFKYPIMFLKTKNIKEILTNSYKFFKENISYTILITLAIILIAIIINSIFLLINFVLTFAQNLGILFTILFALYIILRTLANLIISVWTSLFLFLNYKK